MIIEFHNTSILALLPIITVFLGGAIGLIKRTESRFTYAMLHFSIGAVIAIVSIEFVPDIIKKHKSMIVEMGITLGIVTMLLIKYVVEKNRDKKNELKNIGKLKPDSVLAIGIDLAITGILLRISFSAAYHKGVLLAIVIMMQLFCFSLSTMVKAIKNTRSFPKSVLILLYFAMAFFVGVTAGAIILMDLQQEQLTAILSFGLAALVTKVLLTELQDKEIRGQTVYFFSGLILFLAIGVTI